MGVPKCTEHDAQADHPERHTDELLAEVAELAKVLNQTSDLPIKALLQAGSNHLGNDAGVVCGLKTDDEKLAYLSSLDQAITAQLSAPLRDGLERFVQPETDAGHIAELFLTVISHINRREVFGEICR